MITTDFIEMEMDDATLHVKKDCRDSFGLLCQEIQELRSRTCTTWLFAKSCIFSYLSLLKPPQNQSRAHALSAKFILPQIFLKLQQILAVMHQYLHNQPVMPCLLTKLPSTQVWVKNPSVGLQLPPPLWDHCKLFWLVVSAVWLSEIGTFSMFWIFLK